MPACVTCCDGVAWGGALTLSCEQLIFIQSVVRIISVCKSKLQNVVVFFSDGFLMLVAAGGRWKLFLLWACDGLAQSTIWATATGQLRHRNTHDTRFQSNGCTF